MPLRLHHLRGRGRSGEGCDLSLHRLPAAVWLGVPHRRPGGEHDLPHSGRADGLRETGESGNQREQSFCPRCGSPIYSAPPTEGPRLLFLRVGTINQRDQFVPRLQLWSRSQQPWVDEVGGVRKVAKQEIAGLATQK